MTVRIQVSPAKQASGEAVGNPVEIAAHVGKPLGHIHKGNAVGFTFFREKGGGLIGSEHHGAVRQDLLGRVIEDHKLCARFLDHRSDIAEKRVIGIGAGGLRRGSRGGLGCFAKDKQVKDMLAMVKENKPLRCYMITGITDKIASNTNKQQIITTLLNGILIGSYQTANTINNTTTIIGFIFAFLGGVYLAKWGVKKATKVMSALCICINLAAATLCLILGPSGMAKIGAGGLIMYLYMAMMMGQAATTMCLNIAEGMMRADVIDYELYRSGNFMPGMVGAIYSFTEKIVASFGATIASIAVAAIGYTTVMPQLGDDATWAVLWVVEIIVFGLPILGWLANIVAMKFYELDKERMVEIQTEIAEKKKIARKAMSK